MLDVGQSSFPVRDIREIINQIRHMGRLADPVFIAIGTKLSEALATLNAFQQDFSDLSAQLESDATAQIRGNLEIVAQKSLELSASANHSASTLAPILHAVDHVKKPLAVLEQVGAEVSALSVNAKVLAALVYIEGVDFTVFTQEIGRLGTMGAEAVHHTETSLEAVGQSIDKTKHALDIFDREQVQELTEVASGIRSCVQDLEKRQTASKRSIEQMSQMSRQIGTEVTQCIISLQTNDLTSQRIEHIATALEKLCDLMEGKDKALEEFAWAADFSDNSLVALGRHVCTLQIDQFTHALAEFYAEVEKLKVSLVAMGVDVRAILDVAANVFHDQGGGSFIRDVQTHADRASGLLTEFARGKQNICQLMQAVSCGFETMREHVSVINSIDSDLRVMGLNATFKCGRLGESGKALGIVAHELRACSRKTEESSLSVTEAIAPVLDAVTSLVGHANDENSQALALTVQTEDAVQELSRLAQTMEGTLASIVKDGFLPLAEMLDQTGVSIAIHQTMKREVSPIVDRLSQIIDLFPVDAHLDSLVKDDIHKLLEGHYTMAGERVIHHMFDSGPAHDQTVNATTAESQSIDDMFF